MGLDHIEPLKYALTGNSWHGRFRTAMFRADDPQLIDKYLTAQTFPIEFRIRHLPKTYATKYVGNAVCPLAIANYVLRRRLIDYLPHSLSMVDLFAGIGGWLMAFCYYLRFRVRRLITIDIDGRALSVYEQNARVLCGINDVVMVRRDISKLGIDEFSEYARDAELIVMSPPCESVSSANVFNRTCEPAVSLTVKAIQLVKSVSPRLILYEEAPTRKACRDTLMRILTNEGFTAEYVNMMDYGCLNPRKRLLAYRVIRHVSP